MMISHWLGCLIGGLIAAGVVLFFGINLGLRACPAGRRFLHRARLEGRVIAHPSLQSAFEVKAVFALSWTLGPLAGWLVFTALRSPL